MSPVWRRRAAIALLVATFILAPVSAFTFARGEPATVLWLSWAAISLTCLDVAFTADVRVKEEERDEGNER